MQPPETVQPSDSQYAHLVERAIDFVEHAGGLVHEDMLVQHVFGSTSSPSLWRNLLHSILANDSRIQRASGNAWTTAVNPVTELRSFPTEYAVVDVETTGLRPRQHRITEIAIISVGPDSKPLRWSSLIQPERSIPNQISQLTGITNQLVASAPVFRSVAKTVIDLIGNRLLIGHNIEFDTGFINAELERAGMPRLVNQTLDTLPLADQLLPDLRRLSLTSVAKALDIQHGGSHRASDDAEATHKVFQILSDRERAAGRGSLDELAQLAMRKRKRKRRRPVSSVGRGRAVLDRSHLEGIPHNPGVYIMRDADERVIYVGKAKDLRKRVSSYYSQPLGYTRKMDGLLESIDVIEFEVVGSELEALVLESQLIRRYRPRFNRVQRNVEQYVFVRLDTPNRWPTLTMTKDRRDDGAEYFGPFRSPRQARAAVQLINDSLPLRTCRRSFKDARSLGSPCIEYSLKRCHGPCIGKAVREDYQGYVRLVQSYFSGDTRTLMKVLQQRLEATVTAQDYERAARLRDQLQRLERLSLEQSTLNEAASTGHAVLVLPGICTGSREVWYLLRGQRWAQLSIGKETSEHELVDRLARIQERATIGDERLEAHHHSVDETSLIWRRIRRTPDHPALMLCNTEMSIEDIVRKIMSVDLSIPFGIEVQSVKDDGDVPKKGT